MASRRRSRIHHTFSPLARGEVWWSRGSSDASPSSWTDVLESSSWAPSRRQPRPSRATTGGVGRRCVGKTDCRGVLRSPPPVEHSRRGGDLVALADRGAIDSARARPPRAAVGVCGWESDRLRGVPRGTEHDLRITKKALAPVTDFWIEVGWRTPDLWFADGRGHVAHARVEG